jgi:hypothetical protein
MVQHYFVLDRINYSPTNKNQVILDSIGCPRDEGFPVLMIEDSSGRVLDKELSPQFRHPVLDPQNLLAVLKKWKP